MQDAIDAANKAHTEFNPYGTDGESGVDWGNEGPKLLTALKHIASMTPTKPVTCEHSKALGRLLTEFRDDLGTPVLPITEKEVRRLWNGVEAIRDTPCATPSCGLTHLPPDYVAVPREVVEEIADELRGNRNAERRDRIRLVLAACLPKDGA
jgi:hypothetical protein